jgi:hypothetical protein
MTSPTGEQVQVGSSRAPIESDPHKSSASAPGSALLAKGLIDDQAEQDAAQSRGPRADAYDRRGYKLGITVAEFKRLPYPEKRAEFDASPRCSDGPWPTENVPFPFFLRYPGWGSIGVIECRFFDRHLDAAGLALGAHAELDNAFYFFAPEPSRDPILFYIETVGSQDNFASTVRAFEERLGKPTTSVKRTVQNRLGNSFSDLEVVYDNSSSTIVLEPYYESIDKFSVSYRLHPILLLVGRFLEKKFGKASDKL